jgi:hypothetical protein
MLRQQPAERVDALFHEVLMPPKKRTSEPIADTIKAIIRERHITTYALGKAAGIAPGIISRWLAGERSPSLGSIEKIVLALDLVLVERDQAEGKGS